jgi:hypothetical protein
MFTGTPDRLIRRSVQTGISSNGFIELLNPNAELLKQQVLVQGASQVTGDR